MGLARDAERKPINRLEVGSAGKGRRSDEDRRENEER